MQVIIKIVAVFMSQEVPAVDHRAMPSGTEKPSEGTPSRSPASLESCASYAI